jgi:RNA polymerase subunit RPABC4/transcription elongation factor Spt4
MFFFIAGIQPKTVTVDEQPRMCPFCGLYQARLVRVDHYFSAFFIPLFRVKTGTPFVLCKRCGTVSDESGEVRDSAPSSRSRVCPACRKPLERDFRYCPYCGAPL